MQYLFKYTHYKSGDTVFGFTGTEQEFQAMMSREGGCFTLVSKEEMSEPQRGVWVEKDDFNEGKYSVLTGLLLNGKCIQRWQVYSGSITNALVIKEAFVKIGHIDMSPEIRDIKSDPPEPTSDPFADLTLDDEILIFGTEEQQNIMQSGSEEQKEALRQKVREFKQQRQIVEKGIKIEPEDREIPF